MKNNNESIRNEMTNKENTMIYTIECAGKTILIQEKGNLELCLTESNELIEVELVWTEASCEKKNLDFMENEDLYVVENNGRIVLIQENGNRCICLTEGNEIIETEMLFQF